MASPSHDDGPQPEPARVPGAGDAADYEHVADAHIFWRLRKCGFQGLEWRAFAYVLMEYGYTVLMAWACTGTLGRRVAQSCGAGSARVPIDLRLDGDEAHALVTDVLIVAVERFRSNSLRRWNPFGGASLSTYFIGRCLLDLPEVYERWRKREVQPLPVDPTNVDDGRLGPRVEDVAQARVLADQIHDRHPRLFRALVLRSEGYSIGEIAEMTRTTPDAVRSLIYRGRRHLREEGLE